MRKKQEGINVTFQEVTETENKASILLGKPLKKMPIVFRAFILRKVNDVYYKIGEEKINDTDTFFRFKSGNKKVTFPIPTDIKVGFCDKKHNYLFFDFDSGFLDFSKEKIPALSIEELDDLLTKNVVAGVFSRIKDSLEQPEILGNAIKYLVVGIAGGAIGFIIGQYVAPTAQLLLGLI